MHEEWREDPEPPVFPRTTQGDYRDERRGGQPRMRSEPSRVAAPVPARPATNGHGVPSAAPARKSRAGTVRTWTVAIAIAALAAGGIITNVRFTDATNHLVAQNAKLQATDNSQQSQIAALKSKQAAASRNDITCGDMQTIDPENAVTSSNGGSVSVSNVPLALPKHCPSSLPG